MDKKEYKTWVCVAFDSAIGETCGQIVVAKENPTGTFGWSDGHRCIFKEKVQTDEPASKSG